MLETEPSANSEVQQLTQLGKDELIEMLLRAKGALGGTIPEAPPKSTSMWDKSLRNFEPVPINPGIYKHLEYQHQLPPPRNASNHGLSIRETKAPKQPGSGKAADGWDAANNVNAPPENYDWTNDTAVKAPDNAWEHNAGGDQDNWGAAPAAAGNNDQSDPWASNNNEQQGPADGDDTNVWGGADNNMTHEKPNDEALAGNEPLKDGMQENTQQVSAVSQVVRGFADPGLGPLSPLPHEVAPFPQRQETSYENHLAQYGENMAQHPMQYYYPSYSMPDHGVWSANTSYQAQHPYVRYPRPPPHYNHPSFSHSGTAGTVPDTWFRDASSHQMPSGSTHVSSPQPQASAAPEPSSSTQSATAGWGLFAGSAAGSSPSDIGLGARIAAENSASVGPTSG